MSLQEELSKLYDSFDASKQKKADKNRFAYVYSKANILLKTGPAIYRKNDFFKMPDSNWSNEEMELVLNGCKQILEGKGLTEDNPFTELGVGGFYRLFDTFHFRLKSRKTKSIKRNNQFDFLDAITFEHVMDETCVTYYNLVVHDIDLENE